MRSCSNSDPYGVKLALPHSPTLLTCYEIWDSGRDMCLSTSDKKRDGSAKHFGGSFAPQGALCEWQTSYPSHCLHASGKSLYEVVCARNLLDSERN